ncbi:aminoglycoside phosphotransferase family protein [Microbispora hainanensis]|uniref:Aminoglycoside phosphotransferase family protein n=1 Tax=Microbispora hainanensis TaxID=568844 RepID=A0A544YA30_9ACTN|nr:aminoglycoside phosphotransferase family protein [Microbispora hainanensis]TQS13597.1 aminoglycoside phosphotransferase family protein [Microbispora hainanensis]
MMIDLYQAALRARNGASGFYNDNVRIDTAGGPVIVRIPLAGADSMDLRIWPEQEVLAALAAHHVTHVPRLLHTSRHPAFQVHEYIPGEVVDDIAPRGVRLPPVVPHDVVDLFAQLATVPRDKLPALPTDWPVDGDTPAFASRLSRVTEGVYATFRQRFGALFTALGVPDEPLVPVLTRWDNLTLRPFVLVHADVHRKNMILSNGRVVFLDWELALWGDPVYELAVHLHKMSYLDDERSAVLGRWANVMPPTLLRGWEADLETYLAHERVKSAIVDTVRYSQLLTGASFNADDEHHLIGKLAQKLNAAGEIWRWAEPIMEERVAALVHQAID